MTVINLQYSTIQQPLPDFIYEDIRSYVLGSNLYQPQSSDLIQKLSDMHSVPTNYLLLTCGSNEAIMVLKRAYHDRTHQIFTPTYKEYDAANRPPSNVVRHWSADNTMHYTINPQKYTGTNVIFVANPNNPFGYTEKEDIFLLIQNNPESLIVIDEAYSKFANLSVLREVANYPNLVVLRSFSKDYGMAGFRIGYIAAHPSILSTVKMYTQDTNTAYAAVGAAISALNHESYFQELIESTAVRRDDFFDFLRTHKFRAFASKLNAILIQFPSVAEGRRFHAFMKEHQIILSLGNSNSNVGLDDSYVRITIGTKAQMDVVKDRMKEYREHKGNPHAKVRTSHSPR